MFSNLHKIESELIGTIKTISRSGEEFVKLCDQLQHLDRHIISFSANFQWYANNDERLEDFDDHDTIFALTIIEFGTQNQIQTEPEAKTVIFKSECVEQIPRINHIDLWRAEEMNYQLDCPGATVIHHYHSGHRKEIRKKYFTMLHDLLKSESLFRNLNNVITMKNVVKNAIRITELLYLMRIICVGLADESDLNSFLTRELYDPRLLIAIAKFVDQHSILTSVSPLNV